MCCNTRVKMWAAGVSLSRPPPDLLPLSPSLSFSPSCNTVVPVRPVWPVRTSPPFWMNELYCYILTSVWVCVCVCGLCATLCPTWSIPLGVFFYHGDQWHECAFGTLGKLPPTFINGLDRSLAFLVVTKATHLFVCCAGKCWWSSLRVGVRRGHTGRQGWALRVKKGVVFFLTHTHTHLPI